MLFGSEPFSSALSKKIDDMIKGETHDIHGWKIKNIKTNCRDN